MFAQSQLPLNVTQFTYNIPISRFIALWNGWTIWEALIGELIISMIYHHIHFQDIMHAEEEFGKKSDLKPFNKCEWKIISERERDRGRKGLGE